MDKTRELKELYRGFRLSVKDWIDYRIARRRLFDFIEDNFSYDEDLKCSYYAVKEELEDYFDKRTPRYREFHRAVKDVTGWSYCDERKVLKELREYKNNLPHRRESFVF